MNTTESEFSFLGVKPLRRRTERGIALIMVIIVLAALLLVGGPFIISMINFQKSGDTSVKIQTDAISSYGTVEWAIDSLSQNDKVRNNQPLLDYGETLDDSSTEQVLDPDTLPDILKNTGEIRSGVQVEDETGKIDVNSLTLQLTQNLLCLIPVQPVGELNAIYKMLLWPIRPEANETWRLGIAAAPRNNYRPFRSVTAVREIANIQDIDPGWGAGYLTRDIYLRMQDILRVDVERMKTSRFIPSTVLAEDVLSPSVTLQAAWAPNLNAGSIIRIEQTDDPVKYEYNLCRKVDQGDGDENGTMEVTLLFPVKTNYEPDVTVISVLERTPVNINTASFRALFAVLRMIKGTVPGVAAEVEINEDEALTVAEAIVRDRKYDALGPFTPDRFLAMDIAGTIEFLSSPAEAEQKEALIKLHAFNPYHPDFSASTVGFIFASDRTFSVSGLTGIVNQNSGTLDMSGSETMLVNIWPWGTDELAWVGSQTQYEFQCDIMNTGLQSLLTGPNPVQAVDYGSDAGMKGFSDDPDSGYLALEPLGTFWNQGYSERTTFLAEFDTYSKSTVFDGDKWFDVNTVGGQAHTGDISAGGASVYDSGDAANFWKNDLTVEGAAIGYDADLPSEEYDYLEYEMINPAAAQSKLQRSGMTYEGCSFGFWIKADDAWDTTGKHYFFDITRGDSEMPVGMDAGTWALMRDFENRMSFHYEYDDTSGTGELVLMVKDTSIEDSDLPLNYAEARAEAKFVPGLWYYIQGVIKPRAGGWYNISTLYNMALFVDGKPCWKLDPSDGDDQIKYTRMSPGGFLAGNLNSSSPSISLTDTSQLPDTGVVLIANERIEYRQNNKASNTLLQCYRGTRGSAAAQHYEGEMCSLFGYSSNIEDFPLYPGGAVLQDELGSSADMPSLIIDCDNTDDGTDNLDFEVIEPSVEGDPGTIDIGVSGQTFAMFPQSGLVEINCNDGQNNAIVYYRSRTDTILENCDWSAVTTNFEDSTHPITYPDSTLTDEERAQRHITIRVISIKTTENTAGLRYPAADVQPGGRRYIQFEDEWIEYGRNDCIVSDNTGILVHDPDDAGPLPLEYYFYGVYDDMRDTAPTNMGAGASAHTAGVPVIPVFRVSNHGPMLSNRTDCPKDKVTVVCVDKDDLTIELYKEQMTINRSGSSGFTRVVSNPADPADTMNENVSLRWVAFTANVSNTYFDSTTDTNGDSRLVKFPSGEMPQVLSQKITVGNSRDHANPLRGELDSFRINRAGYRPDAVYDIDAQREEPRGDDYDVKPAAPMDLQSLTITDSTVIDQSHPVYIEIERNTAGGNALGGENFKASGYLRMKDEVFAYVFVRALPYWRQYDGPEYDWIPHQWSIPARYKLRLIERGCFKTPKRNHSRTDPVFIFETLSMTLITGGTSGDDLTSSDYRIYALSNKEFPPEGYLRVGNEIIGYTFRGKTLGGREYFSMEHAPDGTNQGYMRGRFGTQAVPHTGFSGIDDADFTAASLFPARYADNAPVLFNAAGTVTERFNPFRSAVYRKIYRRSNTVFGLENTDSSPYKDQDLKVKTCVFDSEGNRIPIPENRQIRILAGAGDDVDWVSDPAALPEDYETELQEFIIGPGDGGDDEVLFDLKAVRNRLEFRLFFEYLPGSWSAADDIAIFDPGYNPSAAGIFNWKQRPVIESFLIGIRGKNIIYSVARD